MSSGVPQPLLQGLVGRRQAPSPSPVDAGTSASPPGLPATLQLVASPTSQQPGPKEFLGAPSQGLMADLNKGSSEATSEHGGPVRMSFLQPQKQQGTRKGKLETTKFCITEMRGSPDL